MSTAIDNLDAEIARLQAEAARIERAPPTIADRYAAAEAELRDAEQLYLAHGLQVNSGPPTARTGHVTDRA